MKPNLNNVFILFQNLPPGQQQMSVAVFYLKSYSEIFLYTLIVFFINYRYTMKQLTLLALYISLIH